MAVASFTKSGTRATAAPRLDKTIFGVETINQHLLKQAYLSYLDNGRKNLAVAKKRGQVRGGGQKPWRQKGTGRARFGSSRNPIWRGGGVAFGPTGNENYNQKLSQRLKHQALRQALSLAVGDNKLSVVESFDSADGKVKPIVKLLQKMNLSDSTLLVVSQKSALIERATRNIPSLKVVQAKYLTVYDILNADQVIISRKAVDIVHDWLAVSKTKAVVEPK